MSRDARRPRNAADAQLEPAPQERQGPQTRALSPQRKPQATTGILPILVCHSFGPVWCTLVPAESTATVTGMS